MQEHLSIANIEMLLEASRIIHHTEFVIIGSLSVMGALREPPRAKVMSIDVGFYLKRDPGRAFDLMLFIGQGSEFNHQHSNYADAVSSFFPTLPEDWEEPLIFVRFDSGIRALFLSPNDTAVSKYAHGEETDRRWIRAGHQACIVNLSVVQYHVLYTVMEREEKALVRRLIDEDEA